MIRRAPRSTLFPSRRSSDLLESLATAGRQRSDQQVFVGFQGDWLGDADLRESEWVREPRAAWEKWQGIGADGAIVLARTTSDVDALVDARSRW